MEKVLVVDDEVGIADTVAAYFVKEGWNADIAYTGSEALALFYNSCAENSSISRTPYSLAILDLMLPDLPGEELCRRFRARSPIPVIMLTARVGSEAAVAGLDAGADDYLEKPFSPRELLARARAVLRRYAHLGSFRSPDGVLNFASIQIDLIARMVRKDGRRLELTATEWRLVELLASTPGRIFTRAEIVDRVLGDDYDGFDRTVDAHIRNLRKKIEEDSGHPRLVETVRGLGYRLGVVE
jgi:DNA-binding response OmpR family regulator